MRASLIVGSNLAVIGLVMTAVALGPKPSHAVAVIVSPFAGEARAASVGARAGGALIAAASHAWLVLARSEDPDFAMRLYAAGALAVIDAAAAAGCN